MVYHLVRNVGVITYGSIQTEITFLKVEKIDDEQLFDADFNFGGAKTNC